MDRDTSARRPALLEQLTELDCTIAAVEATHDDAWLRDVARTPEFVLLVDDALQVRFLNRVQEGGSDALGTPLLTHVQNEDRPQLVDAIERARRRGATEHCSVRASGPHGAMAPYSVWVVPPSSGGPQSLTMLICVDLEHRLRIEQDLQDERSVLRSLLDHTPDHVMLVDREHRVLFANRGVGGLDLDQLLAAPLERFVQKPYRSRMQRAVDEVFSTGKGVVMEVCVDLPRGTHWYESRLGPVYVEEEVERVCVTSSDITARRALEEQRAKEREALRESEERFRTLVEHAPEALVILDPETGLFVDVNSQACKMFGTTRDRLLQLGPVELSPAHQPNGQRSEDAVRGLIETTLAGGVQPVEWVHQTIDGSTIPCEVRLVRLPYGHRMLLRGSLLDISARKQVEAERTRLSEELFQARKLQAIGQLTGGVAHDFNNLLTVIMSQAEMLEIGAVDGETVRQRADGILQACRRAATLTQSLLAFARRQPLRPRLIQPVGIARNVARLLHRTLGEKVELRIHEDAEHWSCEVDPAQLENALLNLVINARDALPRGGRVDIGIHNVHTPSITTRDGESIAEGDYVLLRVADDGEGMTPGVLEKAFEPFFTTKEVGSGSGLGLSMVHGFVRQSGGYVEIDSAPGCGTRVSIYLPRIQVLEHVRATTVQKPAAPRGQGQRVVVVEDEAQVREVTVNRLQCLGYEALAASDAAAGLALLESQKADLLLTDVVLPGGRNGAELATQAGAKWPGLPVVFMSGYPQGALSERDRIDQHLILLQKPFTLEQLAIAVRKALKVTKDRPWARA